MADSNNRSIAQIIMEHNVYGLDSQLRRSRHRGMRHGWWRFFWYFRAGSRFCCMSPPPTTQTKRGCLCTDYAISCQNANFADINSRHTTVHWIETRMMFRTFRGNSA